MATDPPNFPQTPTRTTLGGLQVSGYSSLTDHLSKDGMMCSGSP